MFITLNMSVFHTGTGKGQRFSTTSVDFQLAGYCCNYILSRSRLMLEALILGQILIDPPHKGDCRFNIAIDEICIS